MGTEQSRLPPDILEDLHKHTHFSIAEIQDKYKEFIDDYPSGHLQMEEFQEAYRNIVRRGDPSKFAEYVFRSFDIDGDGVLDFREFLIALHTTSRGTIEQKLRLAFRMYDLDGNGYISCDEMLEVAKSLYKILGRMSFPYDESTAKKRVAKLFRKLDINDDGRITFEEFQEVARNDPSILELLNYYSPTPNT